MMKKLFFSVLSLFAFFSLNAQIVNESSLKEISKSGWKVVDFSDVQPSNFPQDIFTADQEGKTGAYWQSWYGHDKGIGAPDGNVNQYPLPHWIIIDLGRSYNDIVKFKVQRRTDRSSVKTLEFYLSDELDYLPGSNPNREGFYPDHANTANPIDPEVCSTAYEVNPAHNNPNVGGFVWKKLGQVEFDNFANGTYQGYDEKHINDADAVFNEAAIKTGYVDASNGASGRYLLIYMPNTHHVEKNNCSIKEISLWTSEIDKSGWTVVDFSDVQPSNFPQDIFTGDQEGKTGDYWQSWYGHDKGIGASDGNVNQYPIPHWIIVDMGTSYSDIAKFKVQRRTDRSSIKTLEFYLSDELDYLQGSNPNREGFYPDHANTANPVDPTVAPRAYEVNPAHNNPNVGGFVWKKLGQVEFDNFANGTYQGYDEKHINDADVTFNEAAIKTGTVEGAVASGRYLLLYMPNTHHVEKNNVSIKEIALWRGASYQGKPFGSYHAAPGIIEAEDFDGGGEGVAYHDLYTGHQGGGTIYYRPDENVEIETGPGTGYHIGWTNAGEWLNYSVYVSETVYYDFLFDWASDSETSFGLSINGVTINPSLIIPATGGFNAYQTVKVENIRLDKGKNLITINVIHGNFDKFEIAKPILAPPTDPDDYAGTPYTSTFPVPSNTPIPAVEYDKGGDGLAYHEVSTTRGGTASEVWRNDEENKYVNFNFCQNEAGALDQTGASGYYIGDINYLNWWKYTVDVAESGAYTFILKAVSGGLYNQPGYVEVNDSLAANFIMPWDLDYKDGSNLKPSEWPTVSISNIYLNQGKQIITMHLQRGDFKDFVVKKAATPYEDIPQEIPGLVAATKFDLGGEGIAYHDLNTTPIANNPVRPGEYIKIGNAELFTANNGVFENNTEGHQKGEWIGYTVNVAKTSVYYVYPAMEGEGKFSLSLGTSTIFDSQVAGYVETSSVIMAGKQTMKLTINDANSNLIIGGFEFVEDEDAYIPGQTAIKSPEGASLKGLVYASNGSLYLKEFPAKSDVLVYSLMGQKVAGFNAITGDVSVKLPRGIYIVRVQNKGLSTNVKVLVK